MDNNCTQTLYKFPPIHKSKELASFLKKYLDVSLGQAQEMVAYKHRCNNWGQLKYCTSASKVPDHFDRINLFDLPDNSHANECRLIISELLKRDPFNEKGIILKMPTTPYTIASAIANMRVDWLLDIEAIELKNEIFEDSTTPVYSIHQAVEYIDNSFVTKIERQKRKKLTQYSSHMYDHRYGVNMYYHIIVNGNEVKIILREFDIKLRPYWITNSYDILFSETWFSKYVIGYMKNIVSALRTHRYKGEILLQTINNSPIFEPCSHCYKVSEREGIRNLVEEFSKIGATKKRLFSDTDEKSGISLSF